MPLLVVAAVAAGGAVAAGVVAAATVAYVGIGVSVVGRLTKSKELMQIGSGMSLGAGVASVASSVFGTSAAAGTAGAATSAVENTISSADLAGIDAAAGGVGGAGAAMPSLAIDAGAGVTGGLEGAGAAAEAAGGTGGLLSSTPQASAPLTATPQASLAPSAVQAPGAEIANAAGASGPIAPPVATDSNSISQWWAKQPEAVKNKILQVGGQAAGGLFDGWSAEQKLALERERLKLQQDKDALQTSNANAQPTVRFKPFSPATGGLLSSTRG